MTILKKTNFTKFILLFSLIATLFPTNPVKAQPTVEKIVAWEWVNHSERLIFSDEHWELVLNQDEERTDEYLQSLLPTDVLVNIDAESESKNLSITWDITHLEKDGYLDAILPKNYVLADEAIPMRVHIITNHENKLDDTPTVIDTSLDLNSHIVSDSIVNLNNVKINLFDYWIDGKGETPSSATNGDILTKETTQHHREDGKYVNFSGFENWNRGINTDHLLIFGDGVVHAGLWNKGAGEATDYGKAYAGMEGIVQRVLVDGYPIINTADACKRLSDDQTSRDYTKIKDWKLSDDHSAGNISDYNSYGATVQNFSKSLIANWEAKTNQTIDSGTESLDYLFDPKIENSYKKSYENITGLFQIDDEGYYYYNMRQNFAQLSLDPTREESDGHFILYDAPATKRTDSTNSIGNFFPFNTGEEVFSGEDADGNLISDVNCFSNSMNHHFGMTFDVDFRQPIDGAINMGSEGNKPMTFQFSGDDDVWIYIDDVLVLDLGGVHSEIYGIIDFASGDVLIGRGFNVEGIPDYDPEHPENTQDLVTHTNLRQLFQEAGKLDSATWRGNTFASNTTHSIKMFYLERGNYDSSISLRFNLSPQLYQQVKKVNQNGDPLMGVTFDLYAANASTDAQGHTTYTAYGDALTTLMTEADGTAKFMEPMDATAINKYNQNRPFNFADRYTNNGIQYYVLKETHTPDGYRPLPKDIVLKYDHTNTMIEVVNTWETGAHTSFTSTISGNSNITYGAYEPISGNILPGPNTVETDKKINGLVIAVPMLKQAMRDDAWNALYGSTLDGFHIVPADDLNTEEWRKSVLYAALYQSADEHTPSWYLQWNDDLKHLEGVLDELPGDASRYQLLHSSDADMRMVYGIIEPKALEALGIDEENAQARYVAIGQYIRTQAQTLQNHDASLSYQDALQQAIWQTVDDIMQVEVENTGSNKGFSFLNVDQFTRNFRSLIFIPNEQRELRVQKIDEDGKAINGALFGIYTDEQATGEPIAVGKTANVDGQDGVLIFSPVDMKQDGYAKIEWANLAKSKYYLKEITAPKGYKINPTIVPIVVGTYSIYADAGTKDNGITVMAGVGKLFQTMTNYASDGQVDITLRDIKAYGQTQPSDAFELDGWKDMTLEGTDVKRVLNLHYGKNAVVDYGLHNEDGGLYFKPYFVTDTGFIRTRVEQNYAALNDELYEGALNNSNRVNLNDTDITGLFSLLNIVVVTNTSKTDTSSGELTISKKILTENLSDAEYLRMFEFDIVLLDKNGQPLADKYYFYGTDKSGFIQSGETLLLHHDESITILGLPEGTTYKVQEHSYDDYTVQPSGGETHGMILDNHTSMAAFFNTKIDKSDNRQYGNLEIKKTIIDPNPDTEREFKFIVTLKNADGQELTESFNYIGSKAGTLKSGDSLTLGHNQNVLLMQLPQGTIYSVEEVKTNDYQATAQNNNGHILANQTVTATFYNLKQTISEENGNLMLKKTVSGNKAEYERAFTFTIELFDEKGQALTDSFTYMGSHEGTLQSGDKIKLKNNEVIVIQNLPLGTHYQISEVEANQEQYQTTSEHDTGVIEKGQTVLASFVNHRGSNDDLTDDNPSNNTTTNDNASILPWVCICLSSLLILLIITVIKHQKKLYHK